MDQDKLEKQLGQFKKTCREAGFKLTYQRQEIYRELICSDDHPSAETLHMRLTKKMPMLSLDTVYRTLATFVRIGLIQKVETIESQARFDAREERHHHAICNQCNEIINFYCTSIDELQLPEALRSWGKIDRRDLVVYGICRKCLKNKLSKI
ncbi:MAG TPA: transcriptional repressor [Syntrophales bacterium]|nr:transcriptional repressor [Syntrophales bacterium]HOI17920.1 transcriptional repressor [Geobacteraceae bacterium]